MAESAKASVCLAHANLGRTSVQSPDILYDPPPKSGAISKTRRACGWVPRELQPRRQPSRLWTRAAPSGLGGRRPEGAGPRAEERGGVCVCACAGLAGPGTEARTLRCKARGWSAAWRGAGCGSGRVGVLACLLDCLLACSWPHGFLPPAPAAAAAAAAWGASWTRPRRRSAGRAARPGSRRAPRPSWPGSCPQVRGGPHPDLPGHATPCHEALSTVSSVSQSVLYPCDHGTTSQGI